MIFLRRNHNVHRIHHDLWVWVCLYNDSTTNFTLNMFSRTRGFCVGNLEVVCSTSRNGFEIYSGIARFACNITAFLFNTYCNILDLSA